MNETTGKLPEWQAATVRASRMVGQWASRSMSGSWITVGLIAGSFLALIGALGSYDYALPVRLAFWLPLCMLAGLIALAVELAMKRLGFAPSGQRWRWLVFIVIFALLMTPVAFSANAVSGSVVWADMPMYFRNSLILSTAYVGCRQIVRTLGGVALGSETQDADEPDPAAAFMRRLPPELRQARLIALSSEGHYVRVHTSTGSTLILLRLKDAIHDLRGVDGAQTHRSWWVTRAAVDQVVREDGRVSLKLINGETAPVSRTQARALKASGWLD